MKSIKKVLFILSLFFVFAVSVWADDDTHINLRVGETVERKCSESESDIAYFSLIKIPNSDTSKPATCLITGLAEGSSTIDNLYKAASTEQAGTVTITVSGSVDTGTTASSTNFSPYDLVKFINGGQGLTAQYIKSNYKIGSSNVSGISAAYFEDKFYLQFVGSDKSVRRSNIPIDVLESSEVYSLNYNNKDTAITKIDDAYGFLFDYFIEMVESITGKKTVMSALSSGTMPHNYLPIGGAFFQVSDNYKLNIPLKLDVYDALSSSLSTPVEPPKEEDKDDDPEKPAEPEAEDKDKDEGEDNPGTGIQSLIFVSIFLFMVASIIVISRKVKKFYRI